MQDLPQYQYYTSGCATPPVTPIPKLIPNITSPIYYVVGYDIGIKEFILTVNSLWSTLTPCQLQLLSYAIKMVDNSSLPIFVSFDRSSLSI